MDTQPKLSWGWLAAALAVIVIINFFIQTPMSQKGPLFLPEETTEAALATPSPSTPGTDVAIANPYQSDEQIKEDIKRQTQQREETAKILVNKNLKASIVRAEAKVAAADPENEKATLVTYTRASAPQEITQKLQSGQLVAH